MTYLTHEMLELGPGRIQSVDVRVKGELGEGLPGRLVAVDVHRVGMSQGRFVTNWKLRIRFQKFYKMGSPGDVATIGIPCMAP